MLPSQQNSSFINKISFSFTKLKFLKELLISRRFSWFFACLNTIPLLIFMLFRENLVKIRLKPTQKLEKTAILLVFSCLYFDSFEGFRPFFGYFAEKSCETRFLKLVSRQISLFLPLFCCFSKKKPQKY